jgi:hypothetical protein
MITTRDDNRRIVVGSLSRDEGAERRESEVRDLTILVVYAIYMEVAEKDT